MSTSNFSFCPPTRLAGRAGRHRRTPLPLRPRQLRPQTAPAGRKPHARVADRIGLSVGQSTQAELLRAVDQRLGLDPQVRQILHALRQRGNEAAHQVNHRIGYREGLESIKLARELACGFTAPLATRRSSSLACLCARRPQPKLVTLQQQIAALQGQLQQTQTAQAAQAEIAQCWKPGLRKSATWPSVRRRARHLRATGRRSQPAPGRAAKALDERPRTRLMPTLPRATPPPCACGPSARPRPPAGWPWTKPPPACSSTRCCATLAGRPTAPALTHAQGTRPSATATSPLPSGPPRPPKCRLRAVCGPHARGRRRGQAPERERGGFKMAQAERYARGLSMDVEWPPPWVAEGRDQPPRWRGPALCAAVCLLVQWPPLLPAKAPRPAAPGFVTCATPRNWPPAARLSHARWPARPAAAQPRHGRGQAAARRLRLPAPARLPAARHCGGGARPGAGQSQCLLAMATGTGQNAHHHWPDVPVLKAERFRRILFW